MMSLEEKKVYAYIILPVSFLCAIFCIVSIATAWYKVESDSFTATYYWDHATAEACVGLAGCITVDQSYTSAQKNMKSTFSTSQGLLAIALIASLVSLIAAVIKVTHHWTPLLPMLDDPKKRYIKIGHSIAFIIVTLFSFLAWVTFLGLPAATKKDAGGECFGDGPCKTFSGSSSDSGETETWGPGPGWALAIIVMIIGGAGIFVYAYYYRHIILNRGGNTGAPTVTATVTPTAEPTPA